jgi:hypothetical protein
LEGKPTARKEWIGWEGGGLTVLNSQRSTKYDSEGIPWFAAGNQSIIGYSSAYLTYISQLLVLNLEVVKTKEQLEFLEAKQGQPTVLNCVKGFDSSK